MIVFSTDHSDQDGILTSINDILMPDLEAMKVLLCSRSIVDKGVADQ